MSKKLLSDYPRGLRNGFACWWFSAPDALPIAPALPVPLLFAGRSVPVSLLGFPPRPGLRRLPALLAAIALPRPSRMKRPLTSFEQTPPGPCPARQPLSPAGLLIFEMACRTLGKAHGRSLLPEALPWRGMHSSPGRSYLDVTVCVLENRLAQCKPNTQQTRCRPERASIRHPRQARRTGSPCVRTRGYCSTHQSTDRG